MRRKARKILTCLCMAILVFSISLDAFAVSRPAKVKIGKWKKTYDSLEDPNAIGDGVVYTIKWKKVKGATGYEVRSYEKDEYSKNWYKAPKKYQKSRKTSISFSCSYIVLRAKVRAYKVVKGKKIYGRWSKTVTKVVRQ